MPELKVTIRTVGELAGAQQVAAQLEKQIGQAKALGRNYADLEAQLVRVRASMAQVSAAQGQVNANFAKRQETGAMDALDPVKGTMVKGLEAGTKHAHGFSYGLSRVWSAMRGISYAIPGIGIAGLVGIIASAVVWLAKLAIGTDDSRKSFEKFKERINAVRDAFSDARVKFAEHQTAMGLLRADVKTSEDRLGDYLKKLDEWYDLQDKLIGKHKELALAQAETIEDPAAREARKAEIGIAFGGKAAASKEERIRAVQEAKDIFTVRGAESAVEIQGTVAGRLKEQQDRWAMANAALENFKKIAGETGALKKESDEWWASGWNAAWADSEGWKTRRRVDAEAERAQKDLERARIIENREKQKLAILDKQDEEARKRVLNLDPSAVAAARARLQSPIAADKAVAAATAGDRAVQKIDDQIEKEKALSKAKVEREKLNEKIKTKEDELNTLATDLTPGKGHAAATLKKKEELAELTKELKAVNDLINPPPRPPPPPRPAAIQGTIDYSIRGRRAAASAVLPAGGVAGSRGGPVTAAVNMDRAVSEARSAIDALISAMRDAFDDALMHANERLPQ